MNRDATMPRRLPPYTTRMVWLLTGSIWAIRSAISFADPEYRDPVSALDWASVLGYSVAWILMAPSLLAIGRMAGQHSVTVASSMAAIASAIVGLVNAIEDGMGVDALGGVYVVSFLLAWTALIPVAVTLFRARFARVAGFCVALFVGCGLFQVGGGLIVLLSFASMALAPGWYAWHRPSGR